MASSFLSRTAQAFRQYKMRMDGQRRRSLWSSGTTISATYSMSGDTIWIGMRARILFLRKPRLHRMCEPCGRIRTTKMNCSWRNLANNYSTEEALLRLLRASDASCWWFRNWNADRYNHTSGSNRVSNLALYWSLSKSNRMKTALQLGSTYGTVEAAYISLHLTSCQQHSEHLYFPCRLCLLRWRNSLNERDLCSLVSNCQINLHLDLRLLQDVPGPGVQQGLAHPMVCS